jgi:hypothetical protein
MNALSSGFGAFDVAGYKTGGDITVNHDHERPG